MRITPLLILLSLLLALPAQAKDKFLARYGAQVVQVTASDNLEVYANSNGAVAVGDAVYLSAAGTVALASASTTAQPVLGLVYEVASATSCRVITGGIFTGWSSGMTAGTAYYLSETGGDLQTSPVLAAGKLAQFVGAAVSATDLLVRPQNMSLQGTTGGKLVTLLSDGALPVLDASNLTNLPSGSMGGTAGVVDNAVARANGTGGNTLQGSALVCDDTGNLSGIGDISLSGDVDGVDISAQVVLSSSSVTDLGIVRWDGATGLLVQDTSGPTIDDLGNITLESGDTVDGVDVSAIPSTYQPVDATLTALGGGTCATDTLLYCSGTDTITSISLTQSARAMLALAWSAGTQVPSLTAAGTAGWLTAGTAASNLVQRDGSGNYPAGNGAAITDIAPYAADSWPDEHWSDPTSLPSGWTVDTTGADPDTVATYPAEGGGNAIQLVSDANGLAAITKTFAALTSATRWEFRTEIKANNLATDGTNIIVNLRDGTKRITFNYAATGIRIVSGAASDDSHGIATGDWCVVTVRRIDDGLYFWIGPDMVHAMSYSAATADATNAGLVYLGNTMAAVRTSNIRRFSLRTGSVNDAPPEHTYRNTYSGRVSGT